MAKNKKELNYDEAMSEINAIIKKLESGQIGIEELIASVEKGTELIKQCQTKLRNVELKIHEFIQEPKDK